MLLIELLVGKNRKQHCEWMLLSDGQDHGTIKAAVPPNLVDRNLIIIIQKHSKAVSVGAVPDGNYYYWIVNFFYSLISFLKKNKAIRFDILFQNKSDEFR